MTVAQINEPPLTRYAWISVGAALATMALKAVAYGLTGSVSLLSDALESIVNLLAALVALFALRFAAKPADDEHQHGHEKIEYFSSGFEGAMVCVAAVAIVVAAAPRLWAPRPLESLSLGLMISVGASGINFGVSRLLLRVARKHQSIVLEADAHHLMTDVWTSAGVLVGLTLVRLTGLLILDPLVAIAMAVHIARIGVGILRKSATGLLDTALPEDEVRQLTTLLDGFRTDGASWHALRTRHSGARRFISVHVLVPGSWTVQRGHDLVERVERALRGTQAKTNVLIHLEPLEDPCSYEQADDDAPGPSAQ